MSLKQLSSLTNGFVGGAATSLLVGVCWLFYHYLAFSQTTGREPTLGGMLPFIGVIAVLAVFIGFSGFCFWLEKIQRRQLRRTFTQIIKLEDSEIIYYLCQFGDQPFFVWSVADFQITPKLFKFLPADFLGRILAEFLRIKWERINAGYEYVHYDLFERLANQLVNTGSDEYVQELIEGVGQSRVYLAERLKKAVELLTRRREIERLQTEMREIEDEIGESEALCHQLEATITAPPPPWYLVLKWRWRRSSATPL